MQEHETKFRIEGEMVKVTPLEDDYEITCNHAAFFEALSLNPYGRDVFRAVKAKMSFDVMGVLCEREGYLIIGEWFTEKQARELLFAYASGEDDEESGGMFRVGYVRHGDLDLE